MYKDNAKQKPNNIFPIFGSVKTGLENERQGLNYYFLYQRQENLFNKALVARLVCLEYTAV